MRDLPSGPARLQALKALRTTAPAELLAANGLIAAAEGALGEEAARCWVVGGAVRDAALGRDVTDVDLATAGDPAAIARRIAATAAGHAFELSGEFATWRVAGREGWKLDVAALRAGGIEADLSLRDLTVNAVAVPLAGGEPIDPTGGLADLEAGVLCAVSKRSFADDPLRLMRAARLGAALGLTPTRETLALARGEAHRAAEPAGERQFAELRGMLCGREPLRALELLDLFGATPLVLPELEALRGIEQSANHHLDTHSHTLEVLRRWLEMEGDLASYAGAAAPAVAERIERPLADEMTRREGIRFASILHDIGKPATRTVQEWGVGFRGHDSVGAEQIRELCARFRTSRRFSDFLSHLTRDHLVLGFMVRDRPLPPRRIWDYLDRTAPESVETTLLTIADRLSAQGGGVPPEAITGHVELAGEMLADAIALDRDGAPEPLLRGDEIAAEAGINPGPALGAAVRELAAAQYAGEVGDREAAIAHLRAWRRDQ